MKTKKKDELKTFYKTFYIEAVEESLERVIVKVKARNEKDAEEKAFNCKGDIVLKDKFSRDTSIEKIYTDLEFKTEFPSLYKD